MRAIFVDMFKMDTCIFSYTFIQYILIPMRWFSNSKFKWRLGTILLPHV